MTKRILATLLTLVLAFLLLPKVARAANPPSTVTIMGVEIIGGGYFTNADLIAGRTVATGGPGSYNAHYSNGVLRLNNLRFNYEHDVFDTLYGIYADGDILLELQGESVLSAKNISTSIHTAVGMRIGNIYRSNHGDLAVTGINGGSLTVTGYNGGIFVGNDLTISSGSLTGKGVGGSSYGVTVINNIHVSGAGSLFGESSEGQGYDRRDSPSVGIISAGTITVSGNGRLEGRSVNPKEYCHSRGVEAIFGNVTVNGGIFLASGVDQALFLDGTALMTGAGIAAQGSLNAGGTRPVPYVAANNTSYRWVRAQAAPPPVPDAGDDTPLLLLCGLLLLSTAGLAVFRMRRRRENV